MVLFLLLSSSGYLLCLELVFICEEGSGEGFCVFILFINLGDFRNLDKL